MKVTKTRATAGLIISASLLVSLVFLFMRIIDNSKITWESGLSLGCAILWSGHGVYRSIIRLKEVGSCPKNWSDVPQMALYNNPDHIGYFLWNLVFSPWGMPISSSLNLLLLVWIGVYAYLTSHLILFIIAVCCLAGLRIWLFKNYKRLYLNMKEGNMISLVDHRGGRWIIPGKDDNNWLTTGNYCTVESADWKDITDVLFFPHYFQLKCRNIDFFAFTDNMDEARMLVARYYRNGSPALSVPNSSCG